jgi:hypothetical protein
MRLPRAKYVTTLICPDLTCDSLGSSSIPISYSSGHSKPQIQLHLNQTNTAKTIPQTRRRFLAKYLAPNDPAKAEELYDPRFYIAPDGKGGEGSLIRGRYREVIGDVNDHNWHKPAHLRAMDAKKARGGGSRSVSGSRSCSGANSPRVSGGVGLSAGEGGGASLVGRGLGQGQGRRVDEDEDEDL